MPARRAKFGLHPLATLFPAMSEMDNAALRDGIEEHIQREPAARDTRRSWVSKVLLDRAVGDGYYALTPRVFRQRNHPSDA